MLLGAHQKNVSKSAGCECPAGTRPPLLLNVVSGHSEKAVKYLVGFMGRFTKYYLSTWKDSKNCFSNVYVYKLPAFYFEKGNLI